MKNLRFLRQEMSLSQIELSLATGVPRYKIQLFEQGSRDLSPEEKASVLSVLGIKEIQMPESQGTHD